MRNKCSIKSEFVWNVQIQVMLKVISFSILNMHELVEKRHSFVNSQTDSQMNTFPDQLNWQFVQILMNSKFQSKLRVLDKEDARERLLCFLFRENLLRIVSWFFFLCFMSSVSGTQNKCPNSHHSHPLHLFNTCIYRECKVQNGLNEFWTRWVL